MLSLLSLLCLDEVLIVEGEPDLRTVGSLTNDVDAFLFCEVSEPASQCNRVHNGGVGDESVGAWFCYLSEDVKVPALDLLNDHRHLRICYETAQGDREVFCELGWSSS